MKKRKWRRPEEPEHDDLGRRIRIHTKFFGDLKDRLSEAQNWRCCHCGGRLNEDPEGRPNYGRYGATYEHVVRFADGGADSEENFVIAHQICNMERDLALIVVRNHEAPRQLHQRTRA
ncbi:putative endonuclease [Brevundimonas phage vB_BpoS-Marchewka]|uniref:Endonuclease n=1 Tax=Brevundimonas phage vB_BpoS-Marchewka TaxID=2948604 RepID=A0A9E7N2Y0_9CAUD|nr:putative endonuclease [Brevundimonas phage vB_BpoS-Marchewka]